MARIDITRRRLQRPLATICVTTYVVIFMISWYFLVRLAVSYPPSMEHSAPLSRLSHPKIAPLEEPWQIPDWVRRYNVTDLFDWAWHKNGEFHKCRTSSNVLPQFHEGKVDSTTVVNDAIDYFHSRPDEGCIVDTAHCLPNPIPHPIPRARSLSDTCSSLHIDRNWGFCNDSQSELNKLGSRNKRFVTIAVFNAFVDIGYCHPAVPGTVFTHRATYHLQRWTGKHCGNDAVSTIPKIDEKYQYKELIDSIGNYLEAPGHFGPEQLPRLLRLLATVPTTAKVLVAKGGIADAFVDILVERGIVTRDRIVQFDNNAHVYHFANIVYRSESWPFRNGEDSSHYIYDRTNVQLVHRVMYGDRQPTIDKQDRVIFIKRKDGYTRSIVEHADMISFMTSALNKSNLLSKFPIEIFEAQGHLRDHIALFRRARIIVGPHGAGMMNVLWSLPGTYVVEVGYDTGMTLPEMYAVMSIHLGHRYWLCKGHGNYDKPIHIDMDDFSYIFNQIVDELKTESV